MPSVVAILRLQLCRSYNASCQAPEEFPKMPLDVWLSENPTCLEAWAGEQTRFGTKYGRSKYVDHYNQYYGTSREVWLQQCKSTGNKDYKEYSPETWRRVARSDPCAKCVRRRETPSGFRAKTSRGFRCLYFHGRV